MQPQKQNSKTVLASPRTSVGPKLLTFRRGLRKARPPSFTVKRALAAIVAIAVVAWGAREQIEDAIQMMRSLPYLSKIYETIVDKISPIKVAPDTTLSVAVLHDGTLPDVVNALRARFPTKRISFFELDRSVDSALFDGPTVPLKSVNQLKE
jgi:hypothetical protein